MYFSSLLPERLESLLKHLLGTDSDLPLHLLDLACQSKYPCFNLLLAVYLNAFYGVDFREGPVHLVGFVVVIDTVRTQRNQAFQALTEICYLLVWVLQTERKRPRVEMRTK